MAPRRIKQNKCCFQAALQQRIPAAECSDDSKTGEPDLTRDCQIQSPAALDDAGHRDAVYQD